MKPLLIAFLFPLYLFSQDRLMADSSFGTIEKGSNVIALTHNPGFQVGDVVLIRGGGDSWPSKKFTTLAEMNATEGLSGTYAGCLEDGKAYRYFESKWQPYTQWHYYTAKIIPLGLKAKIISIDGNALTLDKAARTTATNVPVYYDNEPYLNKKFNYRDDFKLKPDLPIYDELPPGRYAIGNKVYVQKTFGMNAPVEINGNGATLFSPSGFPSASFSFGVDNATLHDLRIDGNFKDNGYGFYSYPVFEYWENPYEQLPAILLNGRNGLGYNLHVKNAPGYSFQVFHNSFIRNSSIILEEGIRSYTGWQMLAVGAEKGAGFRKISFYAPYISNAMEAARSTDVIFDSITIVNGIVAFNSTGGTKFTNSTITMKQNAKEGSHINFGHPFVDINGYMSAYDGAADYSDLGVLIDNVKFIQECFVDGNGNTLRAISAGTGVKNAVIKNSSYTRPNGSNRHAIFFSEAMNNTIENFEIKGIQTLQYAPTVHNSDITMGEYGAGTGLVKNVTGAVSIVVQPGVNVESSPIGGISNQGCTVLALDPRQRDTMQRESYKGLIFPNPGTNQINIKTKENGLVNVFNSLGQPVSVPHSFNGQLIKVNIEALKPGLYFIQVIRNRNYNINAKFIKK